MPEALADVFEIHLPKIVDRGRPYVALQSSTSLPHRASYYSMRPDYWLDGSNCPELAIVDLDDENPHATQVGGIVLAGH